MTGIGGILYLESFLISFLTFTFFSSYTPVDAFGAKDDTNGAIGFSLELDPETMVIGTFNSDLGMDVLPELPLVAPLTLRVDLSKKTLVKFITQKYLQICRFYLLF